LSRPLNLTLFPLDLTTPHQLRSSHFIEKLQPLIQAGSPLAEWTSAFVRKTYDKIEFLTRKQVDVGLELHDPLTIWYMLTRSAPSWMLAPKAPEDIRVETAGQWSRGMHMIDRRSRKKAGPIEQIKSPGAVDITNPMEKAFEPVVDDGLSDIPGDNGGWLAQTRGNRINRIVSSPGEDAFGPYLLERVKKCIDITEITAKHNIRRLPIYLLYCPIFICQHIAKACYQSVQRQICIFVRAKSSRIFNQNITMSPSQFSHYECFTPPTTAPLTSSQLILSSSSSSTSPTTATLSPLIKYNPWGTSLEGSGSSGGRITRSIVCESTRFVI